MSMFAPTFKNAEAAAIVRGVWVREIGTKGKTNELWLDAGMGWEGCQYRKETDGTYTILLSHGVRVKGIPADCLEIGFRVFGYDGDS